MTSKRSPAAGTRTALSLAAFVAACAAMPSVAHASLPSFKCEQLADLGAWSWPYSYTAAINNRGDIAGFGNYKGGTWDSGGVVWKRNGRIVPISRTDTGDFRAAGINDAGQVVGTRYVSAAPSQAFSWSAGAITYLASLLGADGSAYASDINSRGQVVGSSQSEAGNWQTVHAVRWDDGAPIDLGTLPGDQISGAASINDAGIVVGFSKANPDRPARAVKWGASGIVKLRSLPGMSATYAHGINRQGVVIGTASSSEIHADRPVAWVDDVPVDLGTLAGHPSGGPTDINSAGAVVGFSRTSAYETRATYWPGVGQAPVDLNDLVPGGCSSPLSYASGINDKGVVAAYSEIETQAGPQLVAFRLTPK